MSTHKDRAAAKGRRRLMMEVPVEVGHDEVMAALDGLKTCLTAPESLAAQGDSLVLKDGTDEVYMVVRLVLKAPLWFVETNLWLKEGFRDRNAFQTAWIKKYGKMDANQEVYIHAVVLP